MGKKPAKIEQLIQKGAQIPNPQSVEIAQEVRLERISAQGLTIHSGCKIYGADTFIAPGARIGYEGPVTLDNCYLGPDVALQGGFFQQAVFLKGVRCGYGAHVRAGTILEEQASIGHTVGLKQTILFPFVTLGSLINFCDCLMAGGTSRQNHSEVGSAYIHFNFTPNQDKATPSLLGDVPHGVMLNQTPIFLGGQGGMVGPCQLAYGTVVAAGSICRNDHLEANRLIFESTARSGSVAFHIGRYANIKRILSHNFDYIAHLIALQQWYRQIRAQFVGADFPQPLLDGLLATLQMGIDERCHQLEGLRQKLGQATANSDDIDLQHAFCRHWPQIKDRIQTWQDLAQIPAGQARFAALIDQHIGTRGQNYLEIITGLTPKQAAMGTRWLQQIVEHVCAAVASGLPAIAQIQKKPD